MINPHPGLPEFDYVKPVSLKEASIFLAEHAGEARPFLGGTDCFVRMRDRAWGNLKIMVDVKNLDGTSKIGFDPARGLSIGAAVSMNQIIKSVDVIKYYPLLVEAAHSVASYQLRTRATVVGNICNASPAGDTIGACLILNAILHVFNVNGTREEPLSTFFTGPGKTVLKPGDIVTTISFPLPPKGAKGRYLKLGRNKSGDLSIVGITALGFPENSAKSGFAFRLALASVGPTPLRPEKAEAILSEKPLSEGVIQEAAEAAMAACTPIDDVRGGAQYRKLMVRNLVKKAVTDVWNELK